jgi:hypothetical protein
MRSIMSSTLARRSVPAADVEEAAPGPQTDDGGTMRHLVNDSTSTTAVIPRDRPLNGTANLVGIPTSLGDT